MCPVWACGSQAGTVTCGLRTVRVARLVVQTCQREPQGPRSTAQCVPSLQEKQQGRHLGPTLLLDSKRWKATWE